LYGLLYFLIFGFFAAGGVFGIAVVGALLFLRDSKTPDTLSLIREVVKDKSVLALVRQFGANSARSTGLFPFGAAPAQIEGTLLRIETLRLSLADHLEVNYEDERKESVVPELLDLPGDIFFDFGKADIKERGDRELDKYAANLRQSKVESVLVEAFADCKGSVNYNLDLSQRRANAIAEYLHTWGGIDKIDIFAVGRGEPMSAVEIAEEANADGSDNFQVRAVHRRAKITPNASPPPNAVVYRAHRSNNGAAPSSGRNQ
jgi:outer membrane protein OmpA-like peptidoglycan-associated protein